MAEYTLELKKFVAEELNKGVSLSDVQKEISAKFDIRLTFLELRLLAVELESVDWTKQDPVQPEAPAEDETAAGTQGDADGNTVVELSKVMRPGAMACGTVKFASGAKAEWILDNYGQLGLDNVQGEYTEEDVKAFQLELRKVLTGAR